MKNSWIHSFCVVQQREMGVMLSFLIRFLKTITDKSPWRPLIGKPSPMKEKGIKPGVFPDHIVLSKIFIIRDHKVMIDRYLAELYGVETRMLNQAVKRNLQRFPEDFMFQMTSDELENWKSQIVISNKEKMGIRKPPLVFTEQGVAMLSSVLNSERAILVNIQIIRIFTRIRELLIPHKDILQKFMDLENKGKDHNKKIKMIFEYLQQLKDSEAERREFQNRPRIGFKK